MEEKLGNQTQYFEKTLGSRKQQVISTHTSQTGQGGDEESSSELEDIRRNSNQIKENNNCILKVETFVVATAIRKVYNDDHKPDVSVDNHERAKNIARCVENKFKSIMPNSEYSKNSVLASIVMTKTDNNFNTSIISISTGTKCLSGKHLCRKGCSINDMHAEIMSRRCFVSYLYDQLELISNSKASESIFTPCTGGKSYKLKDGIEFHLYISTTPCGDANSKNAFVGRLRVKKEAFGGTPIVKNNFTFTQNWGEVTKGKLLTMSCSDKICQWNVVGIQGALLSHFIEPIYLKSVIIRGNHIDKTSLHRAMCGRIENYVTDLPTKFYLNHPSIYIVDLKNSQLISKSPNFSLNWCTGNPEPEIIDRRGRPQFGNSKFCKQEFLKRFLKLVGTIPSTTGVETDKTIRLYRDFKRAADSYRVAKVRLHQAFIKAGLGAWVTKPTEQDTFEVTYN